jgi:cytochrome P450
MTPSDTAVRRPDPFTATTDVARRAAYAALAAAGPVVRLPLPSGQLAWLVTGHAHVRQVLVDPRLRRGGPNGPFAADLPPGIDVALNSSMLTADPPDHGRLRRLVSAAFTRRRVDAMAARIQQITDDLLDDLPADPAQPVDLVEAFAYPLPMTVICHLLGVPDDLRPRFRACSRVLVTGSLAGLDVYHAAATEMVGILRGLVADRRVAPSADLLSALVAARDGEGGDDRLTEDELTSTAFLLLVAGHETTVNLVANGVHALLERPDQLALLRAEPHGLSAAVEELLRHDGPVQVTIPLVTVEPVEVGGVVIPAGEVVVPGLLAANRDPARFARPDRLDLQRLDGGHVAFGHGVHHCLGAPLARLEGRIALGTLIGRYPGLRLAVPADDLVRPPSFLMNGLAALPVLLGEPA